MPGVLDAFRSWPWDTTSGEMVGDSKKKSTARIISFCLTVMVGGLGVFILIDPDFVLFGISFCSIFVATVSLLARIAQLTQHGCSFLWIQ